MVDGEIIHSDTEEQLGAYTWEESEDQQQANVKPKYEGAVYEGGDEEKFKEYEKGCRICGYDGPEGKGWSCPGCGSI